jgi:hypothetical protein
LNNKQEKKKLLEKKHTLLALTRMMVPLMGVGAELETILKNQRKNELYQYLFR